MPARVAIVGGTSTWRRGVSAALEDAGHATHDIPDFEDWRPGRSGSAVVAAIPDDDAVSTLEAFCRDNPGVEVIAVLGEMSVAGFAAVVRAGATVAVADDDDVDVFEATLAAAVDGRALVPATVLRALAWRIPTTPDPLEWLTAEEVEWMRLLATGRTVADISGEVGFSEREVFRTLRDVYARIGVESRTAAIVWAARHGLLDDTRVE